MRTCSWVLLLASVGIAVKHVRKAKNTGVPVQGLHDPANASPDEDQMDMVRFLMAHGFETFATKEFIERLDDDLAIDSIDDLASIQEDTDHLSLGISEETAARLSIAAQKELLRRFLSTIPDRKTNKETGVYAKLVDKLYDNGFTDVDEIEDLEDTDAETLGISADDAMYLSQKAEEWEARGTFIWLLSSFQDSNGSFPFREKSLLSSMLASMLAAGMRSLLDVKGATSVPGIPSADVAKLQRSPLIQELAHKQEL
ncbi:hypothetical protein AB1Y20_001288 [Prymnesium parvum]|uniref:Uncharacterized protein n=1 Tax=Prymnesium parvum TaxID=97485 RepID=A0AB34KBL9_PRYPA